MSLPGLTAIDWFDCQSLPGDLLDLLAPEQLEFTLPKGWQHGRREDEGEEKEGYLLKTEEMSEEAHREGGKP